jgi:hypothetical protein
MKKWIKNEKNGSMWKNESLYINEPKTLKMGHPTQAFESMSIKIEPKFSDYSKHNPQRHGWPWSQ